jgi:hypothetical protein
VKLKSAIPRLSMTGLRPSRPRTGLPLLASIVLLIAGGCSVWADPDRLQCSTNDDCTRRGGQFANTICIANMCQAPGPWSCLDHVSWPQAGPNNVTATLVLVDLVTLQPMVGLTARLCHKLDSGCDAPVRTDLVSDGSGRMSVSVPSGFDGYVQSTSTEVMPFLYFFNPPVTADREVPAVPVLQAGALPMFANLAGADLIADRGHFLARAYNCLGKTAEGIHVSSPDGDDATVPFYMIKGVPSVKVGATDSSGNGGLLNLRAGTATLTGQLDNGASMGLLSAMIRPGTITYTALVPAPR